MQQTINLPIEKVDIMAVSYNKKGDVEYISPALKKFIGINSDVFFDKAWWKKSILSNIEIKLFKKNIANFILAEPKSNYKPYCQKFKFKDGNYKWIEWQNNIIENDTLILIGHDVTNWKNKELLLNQTDTILKKLELLVLEMDQTGNIIYATPFIEKLLGYTIKEILGDLWWEVSFDDKKIIEKFKQANYNHFINNKNEAPKVFKTKVKTKSGEYKWIEWQFIKGLNNTYFSVGTDITNKILTNLKLKKAKEIAEDSLKDKNVFLNNLSHEIRTPLNAIIGFVDLLLESKLSKQQQDQLKTVRNSGKTLLYLVNDVLDFAKLESNKLSLEKIPFDLHKKLKEVIKLLSVNAIEKNISLNLDIDPKVPKYIIGDPVRLTQILLNLIGNSIKFTNEGFVVLYVKQINKTKNKSTISFEIKDTGIGIASNKINKIFDDFTQAQKDTARIHGGTGLGLAIVKKLVTLFKGKIKATSKYGKGSTFTVTIPFNTDIKSKIDIKDTEPIIEYKPLKLNVLLVEDNKTNQLLAKTRLKRWECKVDVANNGIEGVKKAQQSIYDIILMDIQMPLMDGFEATRIIKNEISERVSKTPVIAMTAFTSSDDFKKAVKAGVNDYVFKPFKPEDVYKLLRKYGKIVTDQNLKKVTKSKKSINNEIYTDLSYLQEETLNESSLLILLIESFINDLNEFLIEIEKGFESKDWKRLFQASHKIKPSITIFGIKKLEPIIHDLVEEFRKEENLENVEQQLNSTKTMLNKVKTELLIKIKNLN